MNTSFRPSLNALECRLNLSADPLPVLLVIADQRDFYSGRHEVEFDLVAGQVVTAAGQDRRGEIEILSYSWGVSQSGAHGSRVGSGDDVVVDGRIITGENPASLATHPDFLWLPTGRSSAGSDLATWQSNYGAGPSAADTILKEWDAATPHGAAVGGNETISVGINTTETVNPPAGR